MLIFLCVYLEQIQISRINPARKFNVHCFDLVCVSCITAALFVHPERPYSLRRAMSRQLHHRGVDHTESGGPASNHQAHWTTCSQLLWAESAGQSKQEDRTKCQVTFSDLDCFYVLINSVAFCDIFLKHLDIFGIN